MKKAIITVILGLFFLPIIIATPPQQPNYPKSKYEARADSLRKENLAPRRVDSVPKSQTEKMPVKSDSSRDRMPVIEPEKNQHMPVKELSDTTKRK